MRNGRLGVAGAALVLSLALAGPAAADTLDVFTFADPFSGTGQCDGFVLAWEGHDRGRVTNFINGDGVPYRQIGHIHSIETDTNLTTGKSVVIRTNLTVHGVLSPDGDLISNSLTGELNIGNLPGEGIVIHDSGRVVIGEEGIVEALHGVHDTFTKGPDAFCEAVS
jgi:hypothetical protein